MRMAISRCMRRLIVVCIPSSSAHGVTAAYALEPVENDMTATNCSGQRTCAPRHKRKTARREQVMSASAPKRMRKVGYWRSAKRQLRALKVALGAHEALNRIGQHEQICLAVRGVVLHDLFRWNQNPIVIEPGIPSVFRMP